MPATALSEPSLATGVRDQILAAASTEFAANGLRGASVRTIAARAGATAAMINYYYGSKRALYDVVVERAQTRLLAMVAGVLQEPDTADLPSRLAAAYFDFLSEERELPRLLLREVLDEGDSVQTLVHKYVDPLRGMFEEQFGAEDDTFQAVLSVFGAVAGYFTYAPVLASLLGEDPLASEPLARRRKHVMAFATLMAQTQQQRT